MSADDDVVGVLSAGPVIVIALLFLAYVGWCIYKNWKR